MREGDADWTLAYDEADNGRAIRRGESKKAKEEEPPEEDWCGTSRLPVHRKETDGS
jgi:hypothetical protein